jgi:putative SOS response-associated peptidase YedK
MSDRSVSIFIAPPEIAKAIHGRYVCLVRAGDKERWFTDDSIVSLSQEVAEYDLDWPYIERELAEKSVFHL